MILRDALDREHSFPTRPRRVVSLVPSLTESLFALGAGEDVVGITDFCIFPERLDLPRLGGTKNPDVEAIRALKPDLVHVNLEENLERHARAIEEFAPVFVTEPKSVDDVEELILTLGALHGRESAAEARVAELEEARAALPQESFTFAVPIWKEPWMWCGIDTYVSDLVQCAGGINLVARNRYPKSALVEIEALQPDVIFLPDEPYVFTAADAEGIRARVIGPFPGHLFTWHGTRTVAGLRFLRDALHVLRSG